MLLEHGLRSEKMCTLQFSVDGEFITDLSREWFYVEGKGYDKCMDLLESSMSGTDETKEQIIRHAEDLLLGRAALKGNTRDGTYHLEIYPPEEEEKMPEYMWDEFTGNPKFKKEFEELKEARFDDVCSVKECDDQGRVKGYFEA